jgi:spermidine synthase
MLRFSILLVVISATFFPAFGENSRLLWSKKTDWGEVRVRQEGDVRLLMFADEEGETEESRMLVSHPDQLQEQYLRQMTTATALLGTPHEPPRFLVVGMGAGSLSRALHKDQPTAVITSVELEPAVVEAARRYFLYQDSEQMVTVVDDARHFLETSNGEYDAIFLDAFDGVEVPAPLRTVEFARLLDRHLAPDGAVLANIHFVPQGSSLRYQKALREVFPESYLTSGLAQGAGVFTHHSLQPFRLAVTPQAKNWQLMSPAPAQDLSKVEPYRDGQP